MVAGGQQIYTGARVPGWRLQVARQLSKGRLGRPGPASGPAPTGQARPGQALHTILMLSSGSLSMWQAMTSPRTTGPTFSGVPE